MTFIPRLPGYVLANGGLTLGLPFKIQNGSFTRDMLKLYDMTGSTAPQICPKCGCALLWNGRTMACISCSYITTDVKSEKRIPAAKSKKKDKHGPSHS